MTCSFDARHRQYARIISFPPFPDLARPRARARPPRARAPPRTRVSGKTRGKIAIVSVSLARTSSALGATRSGVRHPAFASTASPPPSLVDSLVDAEPPRRRVARVRAPIGRRVTRGARDAWAKTHRSIDRSSRAHRSIDRSSRVESSRSIDRSTVDLESIARADTRLSFGRLNSTSVDSPSGRGAVVRKVVGDSNGRAVARACERASVRASVRAVARAVARASERGVDGGCRARGRRGWGRSP